ncbi:DUF3857 domain-containing protein [Flavobacterium sp.]|uniref:DUF3857 domain-containing protein n=1 Tax=Flavobacterium sp. TaxID=239 RepID=UPI00261CAD2E|nr:DUF3857 domain-containing protein [Flavobacterium sp.]
MKGYFALLFFFTIGSGIAQKFEFGKVSVAELQQTSHPKDSSAAAAVLYNKGKTTFGYDQKRGFSVEHSFEMRIKIYKKQGLGYANYEVPYYIGYENLNQDVLRVTDAVTYNLADGKVEKTKISSDGKFTEKVNNNWKTVTIALPNVKVGSVIEFRYKLKSEDLSSFPTFLFQRDIPVDFVEYKTDIPVTYGYKQLLKGYSAGITSVSKIESNSIGFYNATTTRTDMLEFNQVATTFSGKDIPALKPEDFVDNLENYQSAVDHELEVIRSATEPEKDFSKTWEGVTKEIYSSEYFGGQLKKRDYLDNELRQILGSAETHEERAKLVYEFVKTRMNWNGEFGKFTDKGVETAWIERSGNVAEINFILCAMLNRSGVISFPVLVSTVKHGVPVYPNQNGFNYVVVATEISGKRLLLDATNKNAPMGILPIYTLNWHGRLVQNDGNSEEIDMRPSVVSKTQTAVLAELDKMGNVNGKVRFNRTDYEALHFRENFKGVNSDQYLEHLENILHGIVIKNYSLENEGDLSLPIIETFDFSADNSAEIINDRMYVNPMLFLSQTKNPFNQEQRTMPVFFGYPKQNRMNITLRIPDGYVVESMPESLSVATPEGVASFNYTIQHLGNNIQITSAYTTNQMLVAPGFYSVLKDYYKKIIDKQSEKIVLKKV